MPEPTPVHLLTCIHGMWGEPSHVTRLGEIMQESYGARISIELNVLIAETNRNAHTYDGVDWGAERVVREIKERKELLEKDGTKRVTHFSVIGYSLGGLLARYTVGVLYAQDFFENVVPVNFATVATPNIGLLRYPTLLSKTQFALGPTLLSRTGKHFYATDEEWGTEGRRLPLLEAMSHKDGVFYSALASFKQVTFLANAVNDLTVPFITSAVEQFDPFVAFPTQGVDVELEDEYSPIIKSTTPSSSYKHDQPKKKPVFLSPAWWKMQKNKPSSLPPPLQFRAPYNLVAYALTPVLLPLLLVTIIGVFSFNMVKSGRRIKLLEAADTSHRSALMQMVRSIEVEVEGAVVDMLDDGPTGELSAGTSTAAASPMASGTVTPNLLFNSSGKHRKNSRSKVITYSPLSDPNSPHKSSDPSPGAAPQNQPMLSDAQKRMITNLNSLPNLQKAFVFLDGIRNAHATIVCRDLKNFEFHRRGEGGLRWLADHFVV